MRRPVMLLLVCAAAVASGACGDPIIILGESPNTTRNVVGIGDSAGNRIDTIATKSRFLNLSAVSFDDATNLLYVTDRGSSRTVNGISSPVARMFSITSAGRMTQILDGGGCSVGGPCLVEPVNMISGAGSTLLIADPTASRVFRFDYSTKTITSVVGDGTLANAVAGSAATTALNRPSGIVRDVDGNLYISENGSGRVLRVGTDNVYRVVAGGGTGSTAAPAPATTVRMASPYGLALGGGILYIADQQLSTVYALNLSSGILSRFAGDGIAGFTGDGDLAVNARVQGPTDVELNANNTILYISDTGNNRVRAVNIMNGIITTYMGSGSPVYNGDHIAAGAVSLKNPTALESSTLGFLFVVDPGHAVVRRATIAF